MASVWMERRATRAFALPRRAAEAARTDQRERNGLRNFWLDGVLGETSELVWFQYFSVYALALGSSVGLVGFLVAISSLVSTAGSSAGALLAERTRGYRAIAIGATLGARSSFLLMAIAPWLPGHTALVSALIAASLLKGLGSSLAVPAWTAFAAGAVPQEDRTRFFALRNFGRQSAGLVLTPLAGLLVGAFAGLEGWQAAWLGSFGIGVLAVYFFARVPSPEPSIQQPDSAPRTLGRGASLRPDGVLTTFVFSALVFQTAVMLVGPFFAVYLVQHLGATPFWVGLTAAASPLSAAVAQAVISRFAADVGTRTMLIVSNLGIVAIPIGWLFVTEPWHVCLINLAGGGLWASSQLATFNLLLDLAPGRRLPSFTAVYQGALAAAGFVGPVAGGVLMPVVGFPLLLALSAGGRFGATALLLRLPSGPKQPAPEPQPRKPRIVKPAVKLDRAGLPARA